MNIPAAIKILAHTYNIEMAPNMFLESNSMGTCCSNLLKIKIASCTPESQQADTLLHEIIEALNYQLELSLEHNVIASLTAGLLAVIRDNSIDFRAH